MHIILDTNIIINYPELLSNKKANTKVLIPTEVIEEIYQLKNPRHKDLLDLINKASEKEYIRITDTESPIEKISGRSIVGQTDFTILGYAKFLQEQKNEVVLATDDRRLQEIAKSNNIQTYSSSDLMYYFASNSTNNTEIKDDAKKIENSERWSILINIVIAILAIIVVIFIIRNFQEYLDVLTNIVWIILLIIFGFLLFEIREKRRQLYGFLEVGFAILTIVLIFYPNLILSNFDFYLKICAGLYVMVRGLDNLYKGSENRRLGTVLKKLFRFK